MRDDNQKNINGQRIPLSIRGLSLLILLSGIISVFLEHDYHLGLYVIIAISFSLIAILMNYKNDGTERNAWDVLFFSMPGVIVILLIVGILGKQTYPEIWRWVAISLGAVVGLESLSSFIKYIRKSQI